MPVVWFIVYALAFYGAVNLFLGFLGMYLHERAKGKPNAGYMTKEQIAREKTLIK